VNSFVTCDFLKILWSLYALYVHCTNVRLLYVINIYLLTYLLTCIDECAVNNGNCHESANCSNVPGGYECSCWDGFDGDGFTCEGMFNY